MPTRSLVAKLLSWALKLCGLSLLIPAAWIIFALIAYRDLPAQELVQRYGGSELKHFSFDQTQLAYRVHGPLDGSRPVLMLIHSHFLSMRQWDNWIKPVGDQFSIVRFDIPGHGLTGPDGRNDYSRERLVQLVDALAEHLSIDRFALAGASSGGAGAWSYAAQYPHRVSHLILINAAGMPNVSASNPWMEMELPEWGAGLLYLLPPQLFKPFLERSVHDDSLVTPAAVSEFHELYRYPGNRRAEYIRISRYFERDDPSATLALITAPVLILWGQENKQLPTSHAEGFRQRLTQAKAVEMHIYPNLGHAIPWEGGDTSARHLLDFVQRH